MVDKIPEKGDKDYRNYYKGKIKELEKTIRKQENEIQKLKNELKDKKRIKLVPKIKDQTAREKALERLEEIRKERKQC